MKEYNIKLKVLDLSDLHPELLNEFNRYQETNTVLYKENDQYKYKADYFVDEWNNEKKVFVIKSLEKCIKSGGIVVGALIDNDLIGFANVENKLLGINKEYIELSYIHVSCENRNCGIGRKIFKLICQKVKEIGIKKLYIAAHPAIQTQQFYKSMGCTYAKEIIQEIYEKEPLDIQLEIIL